jgi:hypothetical protein
MVNDIEKQIEICNEHIELCELYNLEALKKSLINQLEYLKALKKKK